MRRSGKWAYVDGVNCTQSWTIGRKANVQRYKASCVPGGSATTDGNIDVTGSMTGVGYLPPFPTEDEIDFVGVASAKTGEVVNYEGSIMINQTTINIPVAQGGPITWSDNFGVNGDIVKATSPALLDPTRELAPSAKHGKVTIEGTPDSGTFTEVDGIQSITLTFARPATTSIVDGLTYRETGNLEADISFEVHNDDLEVALYALNAVKRVRVYVTPTLFFLYDAIQFGDLSNFKVDRSSDSMIGYTVSGMWTAIRDQDPAALGEILLPGGAVLYGESES